MKNYLGRPTEEEILSGIRRGDANALQFIFKTYHSMLCATAFRIVQDREVAKDIVQEVFIRFWNSHTSLPQNLILKPYLYRSTINGALNYLKKMQRIQQASLEYTEEIAEPEQVEAAMNMNDLQTALDYTIDRLPPVCRTVFMLSRFDEMSNSEIADHLQISLKAVEKHITKALKIIRLVVERFSG